MRAYIAARTSHPVGTQAPVQGRGLDAWPLPSEPSSDDGSLLELTRDVWDIDDQLR